MIISAGYNIAGAEVEDVLLAHPAVSDCAVVGAPDPARGAIVKAFVVLEHAGSTYGFGGRRNFSCSSRNGSRRTSIRERSNSSTTLPRTPTGKLQRFKLRQRASRPPARGRG